MEFEKLWLQSYAKAHVRSFELVSTNAPCNGLYFLKSILKNKAPRV